MAAKTFEEWWSNYDAVIGRETCCRDAWNAATEAAVKRFTSTNTSMDAIALRDKIAGIISDVWADACPEEIADAIVAVLAQQHHR